MAASENEFKIAQRSEERNEPRVPGATNTSEDESAKETEREAPSSATARRDQRGTVPRRRKRPE